MAIKKIPCGGFYVDDGAVQNVDGKPVLSAWNADLPKPSVGGYGYTDENNTVHKIDEKYLPASGGAMVVVNGAVTNPQTMEIELGDDAVEVLDKINTDFNSGTVYPVVVNLTIQAGSRYITQGIVMIQYSVYNGEVSLTFQSFGIEDGVLHFDIVIIDKQDDEWVAQYSMTPITI